jgi:hypothetical protein
MSSSPPKAPTKFVIAVVSPPDNPALGPMPKDDDAFEFIVGNDIEAFTSNPLTKDVQCMMLVPPGSPATLDALWPHCPNVKWCHSFFAGVDALKEFIANRLIGSDIPISNGRGAFSSSLAEYAMASALHFNKQISRCEQNRKDKKWDKFVMSKWDKSSLLYGVYSVCSVWYVGAWTSENTLQERVVNVEMSLTGYTAATYIYQLVLQIRWQERRWVSSVSVTLPR